VCHLSSEVGVVEGNFLHVKWQTTISSFLSWAGARQVFEVAVDENRFG
jgi:hypothetical protein